jgi:adenosine deaminase
LDIAHAAGVHYREMFFSPVFLLRKGVPFPVIWDGLVAGIRDAATDFGVNCRLIMDVDKPSGPAAAIELLDLADGCDRGVLVGIGGDAGERGFDLASFADPFATARARGWRTTMHLGEEGPAGDVRIGVDVLRVDRIDHGVSLIGDVALTAEVAARRLPVTCCPTSNVRIGIVDAVANHPIQAMRDAGVLVTVNSDNAEMFGVDMADELSSVSAAFGWQLDALEDLCLAGVEGSWMPDVDKDAMIVEFTSKMDALRVTQGVATRFAGRPGLTAEEV